MAVVVYVEFFAPLKSMREPRHPDNAVTPDCLVLQYDSGGTNKLKQKNPVKTGA
ncbi:MAG: hypothetical protein ACJAQ8_003172 [Haliea salexigens]|jgi:hypothetical protein